MKHQFRHQHPAIRSSATDARGSSRSPGSIALAWVDAHNSANLDRLLPLYAEDAVFEQPSEGPAEGREAIRSLMVKCFASHRRKSDGDRSCITDDVLEDDDWAVLRWRDALGFTGCYMFRCEDGLIAHQYGFWDTRGLQMLYESYLA